MWEMRRKMLRTELRGRRRRRGLFDIGVVPSSLKLSRLSRGGWPFNTAVGQVSGQKPRTMEVLGLSNRD